MDHLLTVPADKMSGIDFFRMVTGRPVLTPEQKAQHERDRETWIAQRKAECRRELEETRDRLCALASPGLQAKWRAKWEAEDAFAEAREARAA